MTLQFSHRQLSALGTSRFAESFQLLLIRSFPDWSWLNSAAAFAELCKATDRAKAHGLGTERQCASFVTAWVMAGADFDSLLPAPREALSSPELNANEKADWLDEWLRLVLDALTLAALP